MRLRGNCLQLPTGLARHFWDLEVRSASVPEDCPECREVELGVLCEYHRSVLCPGCGSISCGGVG